MIIAHIVVWIGKLISFFSGIPEHKVNYMLKLNPFAVKMLVIDRYFDVSAAKKDLKYQPLITFDKGWAETIVWFQKNWLPTYLSSKSPNSSSGATGHKKKE